MNCPDAHDWLQRHLDGEALDRPALERHLGRCADCRELFAASQRLREGLRLLSAPVPPAGLARRITTLALAEQRRARRSRILVTAAAVAAGVLLAVGIGAPLLRPRSAIPEAAPSLVRSVEATPPAVPSLQKQVGSLGQAVASLTRQAADETLTTTRSLLPDVPLPAPRQSADPPRVADEPERKLREVQKGVTAGIEPVTTSARRAFSLLVREWSPKKSEPKK
jgi:hypothetical protein